jgi:hypothetical protein
MFMRLHSGTQLATLLQSSFEVLRKPAGRITVVHAGVAARQGPGQGLPRGAAAAGVIVSGRARADVPARLAAAAVCAGLPSVSDASDCRRLPLALSLPSLIGRPQAARHCRRDPAVTLVGFGWDGSDERKMRRTFGPGSGRASFGAFCDLQVRQLPVLQRLCTTCTLNDCCSSRCPLFQPSMPSMPTL